jgi:hypothetical protein
MKPVRGILCVGGCSPSIMRAIMLYVTVIIAIIIIIIIII